jgi:hypothetical protein
MEESNIKDYKYKMDKVERYFSFVIIIIFLATFKGSMGFIIFTFFVIIVLTYYFKVYKSRPSYIKIDGDEITTSQGLFFKLIVFRFSDIIKVEKLENKIELVIKDTKKVVLMKILLSDNDYLEIFNEMIERTTINVEKLDE